MGTAVGAAVARAGTRLPRPSGGTREFNTLEELKAEYAGELNGAWLLRTAAPPAGGRGGAPAAATPGATSCAGGGRGAGAAPNPCDEFFKAEGVAGFLATAPRGHGISTIGGTATTDPASFPRVTITDEHYGRIARNPTKVFRSGSGLLR